MPGAGGVGSCLDPGELVNIFSFTLFFWGFLRHVGSVRALRGPTDMTIIDEIGH